MKYEQGKFLSRILWLVYFASNLGRLSYTACMAEIVGREILTPASAGLIVTGFFICYGSGQIFSGFIGGRNNPFKLIFIGIFCTAFANLAMGFAHTTSIMLVIWCFNGLIQSIIWPPVLRIIVEYFSESERNKISINISTTHPVAVMFAYISCAGIITILSWKAVFFIYAFFLLVISGIWILAYRKIAGPALHKQCSTQYKPAAQSMIRKDGFLENNNVRPARKYSSLFIGRYFPGLAIFLFCLALVSQGVLRDGLTTWIPVYTSNIFSIPPNTAILSAGILPVINLAGIYVCRFLYYRTKDEGKITIYLFGVSLLAALILRFAGEINIFISFLAFALIIACMMGVNLMLVTFVPARFVKFGLVSFMTGLTNSCVYLGSSVSNYGIALLVEKAGWNAVLSLLVILAAASVIFCIAAAPRWRIFTRKVQP